MSEVRGPAARGDLQWLARHAGLLVGALAFVQFAAVATPVLYFHGGDNAHYLELARALAAGEGYRDLHLDPVGPHTKYPPGFPLLLAAVLTVVGENLTAAKLVVAMLGGVMVAATALLWRTRGDPGTALAAAVWVATVPFTLTLAMRLLSELPFTAFAVLALLGCERALAAQRSPAGGAVARGWAGLAALCAVAAVGTRAAGLVLVPAVAGAALISGRASRRGGEPSVGGARRAGMALLLAGPAALAGGAWLVRVRALSAGTSRDYVGEFWLAERTVAGSDAIGLADVAARMVAGAGYYVDALGRALLFAAGSRGAVGCGLVVLAFAAVGFVRSARARWGSPELFALGYLALVLVWPAREERFLVALFPMLLYYALLGARTAVDRTGNARASGWALGVGTAAILLVNSLSNLATIEAAQRHRVAPGLEIGPGLRIVALHEGAARLLALGAYLRENAEPDARILARKPRLLAVVAERVMVGPPFPRAPEDLVADLEARQIDYVVVDELYRETAQVVVRGVAAAPERFTEVYRVGKSGSRVLRFDRAGTARAR